MQSRLQARCSEPCEGLAASQMRLHGLGVHGRRELQTQTRGEFASATAAALVSVTARGLLMQSRGGVADANPGRPGMG